MNNRWLMIRQLDRQLKEWQSVSQQFGKPRAGWVKTLRVALNMTVQQFANRMGLSHSRITQLEKAEVESAITLHTLMAAADALECELVYAIVPKKGGSLEKIIEERVKQISNEKIEIVSHSMSLEDQAVDVETLNKRKQALANKYKEQLNKNIWKSNFIKRTDEKKKALTKLINKLKKK